MAIRAVLFDLDGTLLPMDQEVFVKAYFKGLVTKLVPIGYDKDGLEKAIWGGTDAMISNDGKKRNEEVFWDFFCKIYGEDARKDEPHFEEFYKNEFQEVRKVCGYREETASFVRDLKEKGLRIILATNPIFPTIATESRIRWAGIEPKDFEFYTTYENISYCKPNIEYYKDILKRQNLLPDECIMVGNDVDDDMVVRELGMKAFLLTEDLINHGNTDISQFQSGDFTALKKYVYEIIKAE